MSTHQKFWNQKHFETEELKRMGSSSDFAKECLKYFAENSHILELGSGIGADAHLFLTNGYQVTATDFSQSALDYILKKNPHNKQLKTKLLDLSSPFLFLNNSFDVVYAHLSIHYFDNKTTQQIFDEVFRVLRPGGIFALLLNSTRDPEYGTGEKIEEDYFEIVPGRPKRFFSKETLKPFISKYKVIILDDKGSDSRREHKGDLIRFIGRKYAS